MKIKKIFAAILACTFICKASFVTEVAYRTGSFITASAATKESGTLGENITWELDDDGTLTISGSGDMELLTKSVFRKNMPCKRRNYVADFIKIWVCQQFRYANSRSTFVLS